ncbi:hypothetical_protein (plasmid) [Leishmania braziliensis MHOM/BR/75/M2904]|nr:unnamed protein product [Leishmania braziliensis]SYZ63022.1 hypothetical_protein [Leishmania braziliensis MHOM/BR/75/M2904]
MPAAAGPSVSDSIAYLQDFVSQSDSPTRRAPPKEPSDTVHSALRDASIPEGHSPLHISELINCSNSARRLATCGRLRQDSVGEDGRVRIGGSETYSAISRLSNARISLHSAHDSRNDAVLNDTSLLQRSGAATTSSSFGHSPYICEASSASIDRADRSCLPFLHDSNTSRSGVSGASAAPSSRRMFRYGKDSASPPSSTRRNLYPYTGGVASGGWKKASSPRPASGWGWLRASSFSPSPLYNRTAASVTTTMPSPLGWRHSSAPSPLVPLRGSSLSSLLWGWGDRSGEGTHCGIATTVAGAVPAASPSPYEPPRQRDKHAWEEDSAQGSSVNGINASHPVSPAAPAVYAPPTAHAPHCDAAYEEVKEEQSSQSWRQPLRRPPLAPSSTGATSTTAPQSASADRVVHPVESVELVSHLNANEHAANVCRIAYYLKDYYAREAGEAERGIESLSAEDVAGLAQCFYIDLYRTVRQARREAGMETSSFLVEDPAENVIARVAPAPPPPPQRERRDGYTQHQGAAALCHTSSYLPRRSSAAPGSRGREEVDDRELDDVEAQIPPVTTPTPPAPATTYASRGPPDNAVLPSQPCVSARVQHQQQCTTASDAERRLANSNTTSCTGATYRAPNDQLAFSGGGTHPVQIITARLPAFRNDDAITTGVGPSVQGHHKLSVTSSVLPAAAGTTPASRARKETHARGSPANQTAVACDALPYNLDDANTKAVPSWAQAAKPSPLHRHLRSTADTARAARSRVTEPNRQSPSFEPRMVLGASQHHPSAPSRFAAMPAGSSSSSRLNHHQGDTRNSRQHHRSGPLDAALQTHGRHVHVRDRRVGRSNSGEGSDADGETGECDGRRGPGGGADRAALAAAQELPSGIVKRPLKDLMPLLRSRGTLAVKYIHNTRRPHLRLFQILDCKDMYRGSEVLMPHFTWATPIGVHQHDRLPRAKRSKYGALLPTGLSLSQQEVPYETALNLIHLEAVYVGAGRGISEMYMTLFPHTKGGISSSGDGSSFCDGGGGAVVVDHEGRRVACGMCAVFVFASRPVAVSFLCEGDRQAWVGAMMAVVERNRSLKV